VPQRNTGEQGGHGEPAGPWPRRSADWLRRHARAVAGCAVVFGVGIAFGVAFGGGGSGGDSKSTTLVNVGSSVTVGMGGGSASP
jgi:hypothetical protein